MNRRILLALLKKESLQILRDPSAILIAFILPLLLLFIFGYGINLDSNRIRMGLVVEKTDATTRSLVSAFSGSKFFELRIAQDKRELIPELIAGRLRGITVIPEPFSRDLIKNKHAVVQSIADGSEPNLAFFVNNFTTGLINQWLFEYSMNERVAAPTGIQLDSRFWYNAALKSRNFLIPGSIAIIMTLIGTLLTALVIAREWERGTMEALMATPVSIIEILLGKLIPYFCLGLLSMLICLAVSYGYYGVPFRGSLLALVTVSSVFLCAALGQGLLISTLARDQFIASQAALMSAFLPAFMLSGFVFEISAMPNFIQWLTYLISARYFVTSLQSIFLVGDVWPLLIKMIAAIAVIAVVFYCLILGRTQKRLD